MNSRWMATAVLALGLGTGAGGAAAQATDTAAAATAEKFVSMLRSAEWAGAGQMVAPAMRGRLGAAQLEAVWGQLQSGMGDLKATRPRAVMPVESGRAVELYGEFERQTLLIRIVMSPAQEVVGFWIGPVPDAASAASPAPSYADTSLFREVEVQVGADPWRLPGTMSVPVAAGRHPAVVLVHGSGPHDRDETVGGARVFRDLAWGLSSGGVVVLRYEKRTKQHGARMTNVTLDSEVIDDAVAALALVRAHPSVDPERVYVLGHSLGGTLAPAIAKRDGRLAGAILLAATARPIDEVMLDQLEYLATLPQNASPEARAQLDDVLAQVRRLASGEAPDTAMVLGAPASYFRELARRDAVADALDLDLPLLVLQGERDYQVTMKDFAIWGEATKARPATSLRSFPGLNHLFVTGSGAPGPAEYAQPGFVAEEVVEAIGEWIRELQR